MPRRLRTRRLIPRFDLQGYRFSEEIATNAFGRVEQGIPELTAFTLELCSVHAATGQELQTLPEGLRDKTISIVITDTELSTAQEGLSNQGDLIRLPVDSRKTEFKTYWVYKVEKSRNDVIRSNKAYCVEYSPDMAMIDLTTREYTVVGSGTYQGLAESWWQYWSDS